MLPVVSTSYQRPYTWPLPRSDNKAILAKVLLQHSQFDKQSMDKQLIISNNSDITISFDQ